MITEQAKLLDQTDPLSLWRKEFHIPESDLGTDTYFVGNSLGLMPKRTTAAVEEELEKWKSMAGRGHFEGRYPWFSFHEPLTPLMAQLVGALPDEVVMMNSLTVNLHLMMATFYRPTQTRYKILIEDHAFPSDQYAVDSQVRWHGFDPTEGVIRLKPDRGQLFSTDTICQTIYDHCDSLALVLLPGIQYYTGQVLDMAKITAAAKEHEITIGFDLAHAAGNIEMELHDWQVDFAAWCTYKYLNSGPGAVGGCFVHQQHVKNVDLPRMAGWWGHDKSTRFLMGDNFQAMPTAEAWQLSNPPIFSMAPVRASLEVFQEAGGMKPLREKARKMSQFFRDSLESTLGDKITVLSPADQSGCQLSLQVNSPLSGSSQQPPGKEVFRALDESGFRVDWREPNVIRAAPVPLYNTFEEISRFVQRLEEIV